jgi:RNA polymerase sigma-70 factor (ECF subfamily)
MKHFLANEWNKAHAQKRGGRCAVISLDDDTAERCYADEPVATPEKLFDRRWALALLDGVLARLEEELCREGKAEEFAALSGSLAAQRTALPYAELATRLGMTEGAVRVAVHRLRQRYRQLLREEVAHTVAAPEEVDEELQYLFQVLLEA